MEENTEESRSEEILQFLTTEHFALQTARSATIQEANWRASLFLTSVSSATVALAFVAQVTQMGRPFILFSLILLPCLYFIGVVTFVRAVQVAIEDMLHARGMARIRHYYIELAPAMKRYLIHPTHDDELAVLPDKGLKPSHWQSFMSTAGMVSAINSAIAGVFMAVVTKSLFEWTIGLATLVGILIFAANILLFRRYHVRAWSAAEGQLPVVFPSQPERGNHLRAA